METLKIDIVNPKAKKILRELAGLNLITIRREKRQKSFQDLLNKLRNKKNAPTLDVITREVEAVRSKRYAKES